MKETGCRPDPQRFSRVPLDRNAAARGGYFLRRKLIAKSPLRLAKDDKRNSHKAVMEVGLHLIGQPHGVNGETTACHNGTGVHRGGHSLPVLLPTQCRRAR
jgi:hypothetical protein